MNISTVHKVINNSGNIPVYRSPRNDKHTSDVRGKFGTTPIPSPNCNQIITSLSQIIASYQPQEAIIFLSIANNHIDINLLQNLAISPVQCYEQVCKPWEEFQPCPKP
ncbi:hypothetical protein [Microcoleus sp. LEGE 07076]|uniref:hypothetical protein n=1 Tax=Microcoleus sp. LEGE 07076 TaxID=915322 RepID=UPI001D13FC08|nr:hypothetical protein [Microcoleus sp. LEGE 07076]